MTSCAYYLSVCTIYKTSLVTECTVHCPRGSGSSLGWAAPPVSVKSLSRSRSRLPTLKAGQRLNHRCAGDKDKERDRRREEGSQRHTREATRLLLFSQILSIERKKKEKKRWIRLRMRQLGIGYFGLTVKTLRKKTKQKTLQEAVRQRSSGAPWRQIRGEKRQRHHDAVRVRGIELVALHSDIVSVKLNAKVSRHERRGSDSLFPLKATRSTIFVTSHIHHGDKNLVSVQRNEAHHENSTKKKKKKQE